MANLVIVESPSKASTIKGYLGSNYKVVASKGHVRDLPKSSLGVDIENGFDAGKKIGEILDFLLNEVIEGRLINDKKMLLDKAKEKYALRE